MRDHLGYEQRGDERIVRASDHPELATGDFFVPPQPAPLLSGQASTSSRPVLAVLAIAAIGLGAWSALRDGSDSGSQAAARPLPEECRTWRYDARRALAEFALRADDSQLAEVGDAVFRLRRAARNCGAGWLTLACQDYRAVTRNVASRAALPIDIPQCRDGLAPARAAGMPAARDGH